MKLLKYRVFLSLLLSVLIIGLFSLTGCPDTSGKLVPPTYVTFESLERLAAEKITVTASELIAAYTSNPSNADAKYKGNIIVLTGEIVDYVNIPVLTVEQLERLDVDRKSPEWTDIALSWGETYLMIGSIKCINRFDVYKLLSRYPSMYYFLIEPVQIGDRVTVEGVCDGLSGDGQILLVKCEWSVQS